jgi:hypothetical protein
MPDGRTIEQHYQCDVKGYQPGGLNWRLGKGKPPLDGNVDLWNSYLSLWRIWATHNPELMKHLAYVSYRIHDSVISDRFANTEINQARALSVLLNEKDYLDEDT